MHPEQYRAYKSGVAKKNFLEDLQKQIEAKNPEAAKEQELNKAAVAVAVHLYMESQHDQESGILTIKHTPSKWEFDLNPRM